MRLGGTAAYLTEINTRKELDEVLAWAADKNLPSIMIGGGSNIIWKDEGFAGVVLVNKILRLNPFILHFRTTEFPEDGCNHLLNRMKHQNFDGQSKLQRK